MESSENLQRIQSLKNIQKIIQTKETDDEIIIEIKTDD